MQRRRASLEIRFFKRSGALYNMSPRGINASTRVTVALPVARRRGARRRKARGRELTLCRRRDAYEGARRRDEGRGRVVGRSRGEKKEVRTRARPVSGATRWLNKVG